MGVKGLAAWLVRAQISALHKSALDLEMQLCCRCRRAPVSLFANPRNPPAQREDPQRRLFQSDRRTISGDRRAQQIDFVFEQRALALYVSRPAIPRTNRLLSTRPGARVHPPSALPRTISAG